MKRARVFAIFFWGWLSVLPALAQSEPASQPSSPPTTQSTRADVLKLDDVLEPIRAKHGLPALGGAIVARDQLAAIGAVGVRAVGSPEKVTIEDRWHLGSCTKAMTATLIAMLIEDGKLKWSTTIADVFPELREKMDPAYRDVTLEQLCSHRSGAPSDLSANGLWGRLWSFLGTPTQARLALLEGVVTQSPAAPPGTKYIYANAGFAIAGAMAERVTGQSWEDLMRRRVFEPLGMTSVGFGAPGDAERVDQPRGHKGKGKGADLKPVTPGPGADNPVAIGPAGIVNCSLADWAKFVALHVRGERGDARASRLLKPESFKKLHTAIEGQDYALGWVVAQRPWGGRVLNHNGSNTMWYCVAWVAPEKDFAVLVTCNAAGDEAPKGTDEAASALIHFYQERLAGK